MANQIKFDIGFEMDKRSIEEVKQTLSSLQQMSTDQYQKLNPSKSINEANKDLVHMKQLAGDVSNIFDKAFNAKLGTLNTATLNRELRKTYSNAGDLYAEFAKFGTEGQQAFQKIATTALTTNTHLHETKTVLDKIGATLGNTIKWNIASAAVNQISGSVQEAYGYVKALDHSLNDIRIVTGKSAADMDIFAEKANNAAKALGTSTTNYTKSALTFYQQGLGDKEVQARAELSNKVSNVTGLSGDQSAEYVTAVLNGYKIGSEEAEAAMDKLAAVAASTASDLAELSEGMSKVASAANAMGVTEDQLAATLSTVVSTTRQSASSVGTAFKTIYARIADIKAGAEGAEVSLGEYSGKMAELGFSVLDSSGNLKDLGTVMEEIGNKWADLSREQQVSLAKTMAGTRQYNNLIALFDNWGDYMDALNVSMNSNGAIQEQQNTYMESTAAHLQQLKAAKEDLFDSFLDGDSINVAADAMRVLLDTLTNFVDALGGGKETLLALGSIATQVFNKQITKGVIDTFKHFDKVKDATDQVKELINTTKWMSDWQEKANANNQDMQVKRFTDELVAQKSKTLPYESMLSSEELTRVNELLRERAELLIQNQNVEQNQNDVSYIYSDYLQKLNTAIKEVNDGQGNNTIIPKMDMQDLINNFDLTEDQYENFNETVTSAFDRVSESTIRAQDNFKELRKAYVEYQNALNNHNKDQEAKAIESMTKAYEKQKTELAALIQLLDKTQKSKAQSKLNEIGNAIDKGDIETAKKATDELFKIANTGADDLAKKAEMFKTFLENLSNKPPKDGKSPLEENAEQVDQILNKYKDPTLISNITTIVGSIGQLVSGFSTLANLPNIFNNDNISAGEKTVQIVIALTSSIPMLISGYTKLRESLIATALTMVEGFTAADGMGKAFTGILKKGITDVIRVLWKFKGPLIVIAALTAAVYAGIKVWNAHREAARDAAQAAKTATQNYQDLNSKLEQFQNAANKYKEHTKAMQDLDVSTQSYKEHLEEANDSIIELIDNNQALGKYAKKGKNGLWTFETEDDKGRQLEGEEALDFLIQDAQMEVNNAKIVMNMAEVEKNNAELEADKIDLLRKLNLTPHSSNGDHAGDLSHNISIGDPQKHTGVNTEDLFNKVIENVINNNGKLILSELKNIKELNDTQIDTLIKNKDAIEEYAEKKQSFEGENKVRRSEALEAAMGNNTAYQHFNDRQRQALLNNYENHYDEEQEKQQLEEAKKKWKYMFDSEVHEAYADMLKEQNHEVTYNKNKFGGKGNFTIDGEDKDIDDTDMRLALAANDVAKGMAEQNTDLLKSTTEVLQKVERLQYDQFSHARALDILTTSGEEDSFVGKDLGQDYYYKIVEGIKKIGNDFITQQGDKFYNARTGEEAKDITEKDYQGGEQVDYGDLYELKGDNVYNKDILDNFVKKGIDWSDQLYQMIESGGQFNFNNLSPEAKDYIETQMPSSSAEFDTRDLENTIGLSKSDLNSLGLNIEKLVGISRDDVNARLKELETDDDAKTNFAKEYGFNSANDAENYVNSKGRWAEGKGTASAVQTSIQRGLDNYEWNPEEALDRELQMSKKYNAGALSEEGLDPKAVKEYAKYLMELDEKQKEAADNSEDFTDSLKDNAEIALKTAKATMKMDAGIESLSKNFDTWNEIINEGNTDSHEYMDALNGLRQSASQLLDVSDEYISDKFITDHMTELQAAAQGDAEAIDQLHSLLAQDMSINIAVDNGVSQENINNALDKLFSMDIPDLEIGAELTGQEDLEQAMWDVVKTAGMTASQAQAFYNQMGFEPNFETEKHEVMQSVPVMTSEIKQIDSDPLTYESRTWQSGTEQQKVTMEVPKFSDKDAPPTLTSLGTGSFSTSHHASKPSGSRKGGGGGGGGSKPKKKDHIEDKVDKYHDINNELENLDRSLERLADAQDKLIGKELIDKLNEELHILEKQNDAYFTKINLMKDEQKELQEKLSKTGVVFDEDGLIANYNDVMQTEIDYINGLIDQYNGMSAAGQEGFEETLEQAQKDFDKFKEDLERYDEIVVKELPDLYDQINENLSQQIEVKLEKFDMAIELKLDMAEAEREWNNFKRKVIDGIKDDDIAGITHQNYKDILSYYNTNNTGTGSIQAQTDRVNTIVSELQKIENGGHSDIYSAYDKNTDTWVDNKAAAIEDLEESYTDLMDDLESVADLEEDVRNNFLDSIDAVEDAYESQRDAYHFLEDQLTHDIELLELLYGDSAFEKMSSYYDKQIQGTKEMLAAEQKTRDYWKEKMVAEREAIANGAGDKDALQKYEDNWKNSVSNLNALIENWASQTTDKYNNTIQNIINNLNKELTHGLGLEYVNEELSLLESNANNYLDGINSAYAKQKLANKWKDAIDNTDSIYAQKQLNDLMEKQNQMLEEKGKLTQHDIDRAEKEYEIALKQIALQEVQQNKSTMKLQRDANGNYSYQFVSDEDQIRKAQDELAQAQNELYNFDKEAYQDNLNEMYSIWDEFQQKIAEAYTKYAGDQDALNEHIALLQEQYGEKINFLTEQNLSLRNNLSQSAFDELSNMYDIDMEKFENMTDTERDLIMNELVPQWDSGVQQMIDKFATEEGFRGACQKTFDQLHKASDDYKKDMDEIRDKNQIATDEAVSQGNQLLDKSNQLIQSMIEENERVKDILTSVQNLNQAYLNAKNSAIEATNAAYQYIQASRNVNIEAEKRFAEDQRRKNMAAANVVRRNHQIAESLEEINKALGNGGGPNPGGGSVDGGSDGNTGGYNAPVFDIRPGAFSGADANMHHRSFTPDKFDTGGYTGAWGNSGKLAILDEKELVLNKYDTQNILDAVSLLRTIVHNIGDMAIERTSSLLSNLLSNNVTPGGQSETIEQQVHIDARFEGQTEADQISSALDNLINIAAQRTNRKK